MSKQIIGADKPPISVARKFIGYVLLFGLVAMILGSALRMYLDYKTELMAIDARFLDIERSNLPTLINSLWVSDEVQLETILRGMLQLQDIDAAQINTGESVLIAMGKTHSASDRLITREYPLYYNFKGDRMDLGRLKLTASLDGVYSRMLTRGINTAVFQTVQILLISIVIFYIFFRLVGRHLISMAAYTHSLDLEALDRPLALARKERAGRPDELGFLANAINAMRENLQSSYRESKRAERERESLITELGQKNEELERFTYTASHDLKSPLITITGFIGLLKKDIASENTERIQGDLQRISDAANKMLQLLTDLLELSRIGRMGRMGRPMSSVALNDLVDSVLRQLEGPVSEKKVTIEVQDTLPTVQVESVRFHEVFLNLIENAIKFMGEQASPRVEIGVRDEGSEPVIYVRDNGVGMKKEYLEKIFGLFERLDDQQEGTGIGLAIVKRVIELHDGEIWAESEGLGKGTTFLFTIPAKEDNHEQ